MKTLSLTAFNRPQYLKQTLASLKVALQHVKYDKLFIQVDPKNGEVQYLCKQIDFIETDLVINKTRFGVRQNPYVLLTRVFDLNKSDFNVYLEEDMLLSPDALSFCDFYYENYKDNQTFLCCNMYNYNSTKEYPNELGLSSDFVALGVGMLPFQWTNYFQKYWFDENIRHEMKVDEGGIGGWDWSIRACMKKFHLKVLAPRLSRSKHLGEHGTYCDTECFNKMFRDHPYNEKFIGFAK